MTMMDTMLSDPWLASAGWSAHFMMQIDETDDAGLLPVRVTQVHRAQLDAMTARGPVTLHMRPPLSAGDIAVGDWVLADETGTAVRVLERLSLLKRRVAGGDAREQLIAANVDVLFIVTSCNKDFNVARLERYLILARDAGIQPVAVLTKADLAEDTGDFERAVAGIDPLFPALAMDARDVEAVTALHDWWKKGQTAALLGSSGVGKTTLLNSLTGREEDTGGIREDDAKGRHTTTARGLYSDGGGRWLLDSPGMRELRLSDVADGVEAVFADLVDLAASCRYSNCQHETEPDCAILSAIEDGTLDPDRLKRWQKLEREDRYNSESIAEARARHRTWGRRMKKSHAVRMDIKGR